MREAKREQLRARRGAHRAAIRDPPGVGGMRCLLRRRGAGHPTIPGRPGDGRL